MWALSWRNFERDNDHVMGMGDTTILLANGWGMMLSKKYTEYRRPSQKDRARRRREKREKMNRCES